MARRSPVTVGLALALVFVITSYGQADDTCRSGCKGASQTFKYQEGTTYKYNFDSKIEVSLSSAEGQKSVTEVKGTVLLTQQPQCNQILRLQNVQVIGSDGKKHGSIPDLDKPVQINFHDGHVEDSICATPGDTQNSLNLKRAIASIFQANLKNGHETDVFGLCPTEVSHHKEGNVLVVQKARNLNRCAYRENIKQDFLTTAFNLNSEIKSSPILNGDYSAKLRIKNGILDQAAVSEHYLYVPFSVGNNGAKASVETTLKFAGTSKDNPQAKCSEPRSIIFEDPHPVNSPKANVNSILAAVKETAKTIDIVVGEKTAKEFASLVRILRVSKKDDLLAVYNQVRAGVGFNDKAAAKKLFLDALLRAGNGDNVEVAIELLKNKELNEVEQQLVFLGLSVVRHPTPGSLEAAVNLLNQPNLPRSAYLGVGTLAGRFCRQHSCKNVDAVNKLTQKLVQKIGNGKAANKEEENNIVFALKALANIHHLSDAVAAKVVAIAQDKKAPNRLRVTALETYLADPCKDKFRDSAITILKDIQQDSEIRIKAYLAAAQCPNNKVGNAVKALLENEPSYQVGGFIVSHIRNLRASANPDKELAKQHLGLINIPKKFPFDFRKYSANGEFSYTIDTLGLANSVETNVIYSQKSFLPRSTSLNLTAEIFGHSFNFLEIETRQENLDRLVEHYFGPKGLFRVKSLKELWESKGEEAVNIGEKFKQRLQEKLRARRDVSKAEIDHIAKQVQIKTNELNNDLDLDLSVKTFGSEVLFFNVNDDVAKYSPDAIIEQVVNGISQGLDKLKNFEETLRSNLLFLDAEFAYPTSSGFPLRLGVEGSSNVQVKAAGAIDVRKLLKEPSTVKISLIPSANIEVAGRLTVDTQVLESGLKVVSTLHTSTGGDLTVDLFKEGVDVKFSLPVQKQNIISASHNIVFFNRESGGAEIDTPLKFAQNKDFSICVDYLVPFIGLDFCSDINGPNLQGDKVPILPFPLSGDAKFSVSVEKQDISLYHYRGVVHESADKLGFEVLLESLGAQGQKKVNLGIEAYLFPEKYFKATLTSPGNTALAEARITNNAQEKSASLRFVLDQSEYYGKIGVGIQGNAARSVYRPILQYKTPSNSGLQESPYRVEGQIIAERKDAQTGSYTFDNVKLIVPNQKPVTIIGKVGEEPHTVYADLTVGDGEKSATIKGKLHVTPQVIKYNAELKNSVNPIANVQVKGELKRDADSIGNFLQLAHGNDFSDKNNILTLENSLRVRNKSPEDFLVQMKNKLGYPAVATALQLDFEVKPKAVQYLVDVQYQNVKVGSELECEYNHKVEGTDYKLEFGIHGLNNRVNLKAKRQANGEQSQIENSLEVNGKRVEINGKVRHHVRPQDIDVGSDLIVKIPTHNTPFHVVDNFKVNANEIDVSCKITSANTNYVDVFFKANKAGNANGSIKINLKGQLVVNGQIKANKGNGNGDIVIELPSAGRTAKIDTTFTVHEPRYNVLVNIYPLFHQDKAKKITISTQNTVSPSSLNSKNFVEIFGDKLEVNVNGNQQGDVANGKINGDVEVILPTDHYLAGKINREIRTVNNVVNGHFLINLEHRKNKNQSGDKISLKGQAKNTNIQENTYDVTYQFSAERAAGQSFNVDLGVKQVPHGESKHLEVHNKIYGSIIPSPLETTFKGSCSGIVGSFDARSTYAPLGTVSVTGKHDFTGSGKPYSGEVNVELSSSSKIIKTVKASVAASVLKGDVVEVKGHSNVYADAPDGVIVDFHSEGEVKASDKEGRVKGTVKSGKIDPVSVNAGFNINENKNEQRLQGDAAVQYGKNQHVKGEATLIRLPAHEYKLDLKLDTPAEKFKNNRLQVHTKRNEDASRYQSEVIATTDGKTYTTNTDLVLSEIAPSIDIKMKCPEGKLRQFLVKVTKLSDSELGGQLKIVNQKENFLFEGSVDANVESVDNFHIKATANSPSLKIDKVVFEAQNKQAKGGRRIQVTAKSGNKNLLAGSTSYNTREEHGKLIVEGSGSFKVKDETKSANFKYIRQNLSQAKNGETGIDVSFDATLGNKAVDAELKITNKQFRILESYCEEKKQCAHVEIDVKTNADSPNQYNQVIEVSVDLRKLGLAHEFGLKAVTDRKEYLLDHTVDIHFQSQENNKYQYSLYLHPKEAGVSFTTPKRIIAVESKVDFPQNVLQEGGRISGEAVLYMDKKNQPNQKSGVQAYLNIQRKGQPSVDGEIKFTNPGLKRPLSVSVKSQTHITDQKISANTVVVVDVFAHPDQKIVFSVKEELPGIKANLNQPLQTSEVYEIKSSGLKIDILAEGSEYYAPAQGVYKYKEVFRYHVANSRYNNELVFDVSPKSVQAIVTVLNVPVLRLTSQIQSVKDNHVIESEFHCIGHKPLISHVELKNYNTLSLTVAKKENPNDKLQVHAGFIPGQIADFRAEVNKGGQKHELGHGTVKLDEANFLKSDYDIQSKNIEEYFLKPVKEGIEGETRELQRLSEESLKKTQEELVHLGEITKSAVPDLTPVSRYYSGELDKIKQEILADKTIKEASEFLYNIFGAVLQAVSEIYKSFSEVVENVFHTYQVAFGKVIETFQKEIIPQLQQIYDKVSRAVIDVVHSATELVLVVAAKVSEIAEKYRPEFQQLAAVFGEVSQDVVRAVLDVYEAVRNVVVEQFRQIYHEIQQMPAYEQLKAEVESFFKNGVFDQQMVANSVKDIVNTLKDMAPNDDIKNLVQVIGDYVIAKLTSQQPVDDRAYFDRIINAAIVVSKRFTELIEAPASSADLQNVKVPVPVNYFSKLPRYGAARLSPLSYFLREDVDLPEDFLLSLVNKPRNWIPPFPLAAIIAQGQHIFTFDGKHLTFPGKCNYLLARDAVDGNFTLIGSYNNGQLAAISLTQGPDTITVKKGGQVTLNNGPVELPARKPDIAAYRDTESITLVSSYGVQVVCGPELLVCGVHVSGFYHGKLRGLLGDGNNEPYDDFTIPNGKIVTSEAEFGNSYKTTSGCAAVQTPSHAGHHPDPACNKLFGAESSLRFCYPFVRPDNFKMACEHGMAAKVKDTEHAIATAYVAACNQHGIPVRVPSQFVKCINGDKPTAPGDKFSVKTPGKQADVVLLVDTDKQNEQVYKEYVQPLVQQLTSELHSKGISDVEFHLIAYGGENHWPSHITTSGGKMTFKGKAPNLKFADGPKVERLKSSCPRLSEFYEIVRRTAHDLELAVGNDLQAKTWTEGLKYPFRANAIKSILVVTGRPCEVGRFFPLQLLRTLLYRGKTINLNVITSIDKPKSDAKNIVGFNSRNVFSIPGGKSKVKHFADLHKEMDYNDYCIDFTVQNDGNVFIADHFLQVAKGQRKQFVQVTSHNIVDQLVGVDKGYDCECTYVTPYTAQNVCHLVSAKEKPQKKAGTKS